MTKCPRRSVLAKRNSYEFGSPSLLLLNRTREVRFMCYEFPFRVIFAVGSVGIIIFYSSLRLLSNSQTFVPLNEKPRLFFAVHLTLVALFCERLLAFGTMP